VIVVQAFKLKNRMLNVKNEFRFHKLASLDQMPYDTLVVILCS